MKKIISTMAVATFVACAFTSCNNQPQQNDTKAATNAEAPKPIIRHPEHKPFLSGNHALTVAITTL